LYIRNVLEMACYWSAELLKLARLEFSLILEIADSEIFQGLDQRVTSLAILCVVENCII
jgi:hypothetical protein